MGIQRVGRRREVVAVVAALLVQVDVHLRKVLERHPDAATRFGLRLREPVAVHVEQIVVRPSARPRLVVLGVVGCGVGVGGLTLQILEDEPRAPVGILHRIDQHERVLEHRIHAGVTTGGQQVIRLEQRGIARADLVPVHAVHEPHHDRCRGHEAVGLGWREPTWIGQAFDVGLHLVELRDAFGAAYHEQPQRAALPGHGILGEPGPVGRGLRECAQVGGDLFGCGHLVARRMTDDLLQRGDSRVVLCARPEGLGGLRERGRCRRDGQYESTASGVSHGDSVAAAPRARAAGSTGRSTRPPSASAGPSGPRPRRRAR